MSNYLVTDTELIATADAIREKIGSSENLVWGETTGFSLDIQNIPSGGGGGIITRNDVNFYDYDGTLVASYSAADFANLTEMPPNPSHSGLTAQGWNWSLLPAKDVVAKNGKLEVGQTYITSDGKTRIYIELHEGRLSPYLGIAVNGSVAINWGDGSEETIITSSFSENDGYVNTKHDYAVEGAYVISIEGLSGSWWFYNEDLYYHPLLNGNWEDAELDCVYTAAIKRIEIGSDISDIDKGAFYYCTALKYITIPDGIYSIKNDAFGYCYNLRFIVFPDNLDFVGNAAFRYCSALKSAILSHPTYIDEFAFADCNSLEFIYIPDSVGTIRPATFDKCYSLESIVIPQTLTFKINPNAFYDCNSLQSIVFKPGISVIDESAFSGCSNVTSIIFSNTITKIKRYSFSDCIRLSSVTIPNSVTEIGDEAFGGCWGLGLIRFESSTPPTLGSDVFRCLLDNCVIYIPSGSLSAYTSAANYPDPSQYTYVEY